VDDRKRDFVTDRNVPSSALYSKKQKGNKDKNCDWIFEDADEKGYEEVNNDDGIVIYDAAKDYEIADNDDDGKRGFVADVNVPHSALYSKKQKRNKDRNCDWIFDDSDVEEVDDDDYDDDATEDGEIDDDDDDDGKNAMNAAQNYHEIPEVDIFRDDTESSSSSSDDLLDVLGLTSPKNTSESRNDKKNNNTNNTVGRQRMSKICRFGNSNCANEKSCRLSVELEPEALCGKKPDHSLKRGCCIEGKRMAESERAERREVDDDDDNKDDDPTGFYRNLHSPVRLGDAALFSPTTSRSLSSLSSSATSLSSSTLSSSIMDEVADTESSTCGREGGRSVLVRKVHHQVETWLKEAAEVGASGLESNVEFQEALRRRTERREVYADAVVVNLRLMDQKMKKLIGGKSLSTPADQ